MNDLSEKAQEFFNQRKEVSIVDGRYEGRSGSLVERDGDMCIIELEGDGQVRVRSRNVYKVMT